MELDYLSDMSKLEKIMGVYRYKMHDFAVEIRKKAGELQEKVTERLDQLNLFSFDSMEQIQNQVRE